MLQPGQYYLIKEAPGAGGTDELPTPDATGSILMGAGSGKVALVSNSVALTGLCPSDPAIIDFVGYGTANCFEGPGAAPTLTNTTAALRDLPAVSTPTTTPAISSQERQIRATAHRLQIIARFCQALARPIPTPLRLVRLQL